MVREVNYSAYQVWGCIHVTSVFHGLLDICVITNHHNLCDGIGARVELGK